MLSFTVKRDAMPLWFKCDPVTDDRVFDSATHRLVYEIDTPVSATQLWAALASDKPLPWCKVLNGHYTSPSPFGVGSTRQVRALAGLMRLDERFFIWDNAKRRHAFYVERTNVPILGMLAEDYQVEETANGSKLVWRIAIESRKGLDPLMSVAQMGNKKLVFDSIAKDTYRYFNP